MKSTAVTPLHPPQPSLRHTFDRKWLVNHVKNAIARTDPGEVVCIAPAVKELMFCDNWGYQQYNAIAQLCKEHGVILIFGDIDER